MPQCAEGTHSSCSSPVQVVDGEFLLEDARAVWCAWELIGERFGWRRFFHEFLLDWEAEAGMRELVAMLSRQ